MRSPWLGLANPAIMPATTPAIADRAEPLAIMLADFIVNLLRIGLSVLKMPHKTFEVVLLIKT